MKEMKRLDFQILKFFKVDSGFLIGKSENIVTKVYKAFYFAHILNLGKKYRNRILQYVLGCIHYSFIKQ